MQKYLEERDELTFDKIFNQKIGECHAPSRLGPPGFVFQLLAPRSSPIALVPFRTDSFVVFCSLFLY